MTYKELLEMLAKKNRSGGFGASIYNGLSNFFSGGGQGLGQSERPQLPQYPSSVYPDKQGRPIKSKGLQEPIYPEETLMAEDPNVPNIADYATYDEWYDAARRYAQSQGEYIGIGSKWDKVEGNMYGPHRDEAQLYQETQTLPQYPSQIYPEKPKSPWGNPELGNPNRQSYTQALIPINDTLSYTDSSRTMIYDRSTGEVYPATDYQKPRAYPQYPPSIYPDKPRPPGYERTYKPPVSVGSYSDAISRNPGTAPTVRDMVNYSPPPPRPAPDFFQQRNAIEEQRMQRRRDVSRLGSQQF